MKKQMKLWYISILLISIFCIAACDDNDDATKQNKNERMYALNELDSSGVKGTVTFTKVDDKTTRVVVQLTGTKAGNSHPAHIHSGSVATAGPIVLDFNPVDGSTGRSETLVTKMNDGAAVTYEDLIAFNGHVNVHLSAADLKIMIAQGD